MYALLVGVISPRYTHPVHITGTQHHSSRDVIILGNDHPRDDVVLSINSALCVSDDKSPNITLRHNMHYPRMSKYTHLGDHGYHPKWPLLGGYGQYRVGTKWKTRIFLTKPKPVLNRYLTLIWGVYQRWYPWLHMIHHPGWHPRYNMLFRSIAQIWQYCTIGLLINLCTSVC